MNRYIRPIVMRGFPWHRKMVNRRRRHAPLPYFHRNYLIRVTKITDFHCVARPVGPIFVVVKIGVAIVDRSQRYHHHHPSDHHHHDRNVPESRRRPPA